MTPPQAAPQAVALPFTAFTPDAQLLEIVSPYLPVRPLTRTELMQRATLLVAQAFRCCACGHELDRMRPGIGRARTFLAVHPTETVPGRLRPRPVGLMCGRCNKIIVSGGGHPDRPRLTAQLYAADPFGQLPRAQQRSLTRGTADGALRTLDARDAPNPSQHADMPGSLLTRAGRTGAHFLLIRDIRGAAQARGLDVRVWYVQQDAGFVIDHTLVTVEVKTLAATRTPDEQLRRGTDQVLRYVRTQQADAVEEPWFTDAGITHIVPVVAVDRMRPVSGAWIDHLTEQGIVLIGAGELCGALRAGDNSWLPGDSRFVPAPLVD